MSFNRHGRACCLCTGKESQRERTYLVFSQSPQRLIKPLMSLELENMGEVPHAAHDRFPRAGQLDPAQIRTPLHQRPVKLLGCLDVFIAMRRDDSVCDLLVDVFPSADQLRVRTGR